MARGSSEIFHKIKVITLLSAIVISSVLLSGLPLLSTNFNNLSTANTNNPGASTTYANLVRPTFLQAGKYLNYSVRFIPINVLTSTNLSANLNYAVNSVGATTYTINETTSGLHVAYGSSNTNRTAGLYSISTNAPFIDLQTSRAYSNLGSHITGFVDNLTNLNKNYTFSTTLIMNQADGSYSSATGNKTSAMILDSMLPLSQPNRLNYYTHYLALLSYYKSLNCLYINPKSLYEPNFTTAAALFVYNGTADINTFIGARSTVCFSFMNTTYKWQQFLYFDMYTGILLKAVFNYDIKSGTYAHQLIYELKSTNVNFGTNLPRVSNEFENATMEIKTYLSKSGLNDSNNSLFNHAVMGTSVNTTKESADIFKVLAGYTQAFGPSLSDVLAHVINSTLHDTANGGFYQSMNPSGIVNNVKTVSDAAWAIIATENFKNVSKFQQEMFNFMLKLYTNGTYNGKKFYAFTRTNASNYYFYASDNAIADIALNWLAWNATWNSTLETMAQGMSYNITSLFSAPSTANFPSFWDQNNNLFVTFFDKTGDINAVDNDRTKDVIDNCMAIVALCEYYLYNQSTDASNSPYHGCTGCVDKAVLTFNDLLSSAAWNKTNKGFVHELSSNLGLDDSNQYLEDNAWAMLASVDLLQAANMDNYNNNNKNITFYDVACDTWACIKNQLYDTADKTYNHSSSDRETVSGDLGILLSALSNMESLSNSTSFSVSMNATDGTYTFEDQPTVMASATWTFSVNRNLQASGRLVNGHTLSNVNILIPLNYSDVNFFARYANSTIYNHFFAVTDNTGVATFQYSLPVPPLFYDQNTPTGLIRYDELHVITASANRTGFVPVYAVNFYRVKSNTLVVWNSANPYVMFNFSTSTSNQIVSNSETANIPEVYPGQKFTVTMNMTNQDLMKQNVNVTFNSSILQRFSTLQVLKGNSTNMPYTYNLTAGTNIPLGVQNVSCSVSKNGSVLFSSLLDFFVKTPLVISYINYSDYIVDRGSNYLVFNVKNINVNQKESVTAKFSSVNLALVSGNSSQVISDIQPLHEVPVTIAFRLASNASMRTTYQFSLELVWNGQSLGINEYQISYRAPIEIVSISGPSQPTEGVTMWFSISIRNNRQTNVQVEIQLIRVMSDGTPSLLASFNQTLTPGVNNILYSYTESLPNPFDIGQREYLVVVRSNGSEIGRGTVLANVQTSIETIIFGYVLIFAIIGAVVLLAVYKKQQLSSIRK